MEGYAYQSRDLDACSVFEAYGQASIRSTGRLGEGEELDKWIRDWHLADIRGTATFCPLSDNSGQSSVLAGDWLSANDPKWTSLALAVGFEVAARAVFRQLK